MEMMDWSAGPLAAGLNCYRAREFFAAHEHWECVWLKLEEPEKSFLQALVQITAAFHHLTRGNSSGAVSLLRRSSRRLERSPSPYCSVNTLTLRRDIDIWLDALETQGDLPNRYPEFQIVDAG